MMEQKKTAPISLQDLLLTKQKQPVVETVSTDSLNDDSMELPTETTFQIDQVYDHEDSPSFFKARKQQGTKKTVVFDVEQELEGISVMVYNEDGQGGGIDGLCAFNDIQHLAGYNVEHSSLAETQKEQKQQQYDADEQSKIVSANELLLKDEIKELKSKNEILTLQLARQLSDMQNQSEQVIAEGTINRQLQVENESIQRDRVHLRRIVATLENEVKRLEIELNERTVTHSRMNESMVATEQLVSQLESESAILRQVRNDLETCERDRAQLRRLVSSLEAEVIAIKTENSQLRCSLATVPLAGPNTGIKNSNNSGVLPSTSSFDYSIESSSSALPLPPTTNRPTTSHPPPSGNVNTTATVAVSSSSHRIENKHDRRRTMSSIDFRESHENNYKLPVKGDQQLSTTSNSTDVSRTASGRELPVRDPSLQLTQPHHQQQQQPHHQQQQQQYVPPSHDDRYGHKMNDHDQYKHSNHNHNSNTSLSSSQSVPATTVSSMSTHQGPGLAVGHMVATPSTHQGPGLVANPSGGTGMQSLAQLIGGIHNNGGGVLTTNGGSTLSSNVHARRHSSSYEPSLSSSLDKIENENFPRPVPNGATPSIGSYPYHYTHSSSHQSNNQSNHQQSTHQSTQPTLQSTLQSTSSTGTSRSLEQFTTMKPPKQSPSQPESQSQPNVPMTRGETLAFHANLHANVMHNAGHNNNNNNSSSSSSHVGTNQSIHTTDRTHSQHPSTSNPINLNAWKKEGYPSEFAYAKAMGVLEVSPTLSNNAASTQPNNPNQPSQNVVSTVAPTITAAPIVIRSRGQGQPMVSTTPFGTDDTVCQDLVAYDELEKHLTSMMSEKRCLNEESERLLQRGGKTLKERTRLTQVEYRLGELNKEISSTRKELTRKS